jgi:hypothetical protein
MNYFLFAAPLVILLSYPKIYNKLPRIIKDSIRMISGNIIGQSVIIGFNGYYLYSITIFAALFIFKEFFNISRKTNAINACNSCSELINGHICSGYQKQAEKIRVFEEAFCQSRIPVNRRFEYD